MIFYEIASLTVIVANMIITSDLLPTVSAQLDKIIALGLLETAGINESEARAAIREREDETGALFTIHPSKVLVADVIPLLMLSEKTGFIVEDLVDIESFTPIPEVEIPDSSFYLIEGLDRGDSFSNWSPNKALPELLQRGASPLVTLEGLIWVLQVPEILQRNRCFMIIGSRKVETPGQLDTRVPALWISNGTGRDGVERRNAPKLGWCWAGNRHTWLGIASVRNRYAI